MPIHAKVDIEVVPECVQLLCTCYALWLECVVGGNLGVVMWKCRWEEWSECLVTQAKERVRESGVVVNRRDSYTFVMWVSYDVLCSVCSTMCYWCCYGERYKESMDSLRGYGECLNCLVIPWSTNKHCTEVDANMVHTITSNRCWW